jgi:hypothetical protein
MSDYMNDTTMIKSLTVEDLEKIQLRTTDGLGKPYTGTITISSLDQPKKIKYKYNEAKIISDFQNYIDKTYGQHYMSEEQNIECFDVWLSLGESLPTFRNTAIKYLWRYGKKHGSNKDDLLKVLHYTLMMLYVDHYKDSK